LNTVKTVASQKSTFSGILSGPIGITASLISSIISSIIVFILNHEPVEFLPQVVLFILFAAFALFIGSHQLLFELARQVFLQGYPEQAKRVAMDCRLIKLADKVYLLALFIWKVAIVILFFARNLKYLGVASSVVVAIDLLLFYQSWKRETRAIAYALE